MLISHLLAVALMVAAAGLWINQISIFLVLLPLYMLTVGLFAVGVGWIVASLHVFLRDTAQVLSVILTFWFWATPIFIEEAKFPAQVKFLLHANPLYYAVRGYRAILLHSTLPRFEDLAVSAGFGIVMFVAGGLFFWATLKSGADTGELLQRARQRNVLFTPGEHFFAEKPDPSASMRLNFSHADEDSAERGLAILGELLREMAV